MGKCIVLAGRVKKSLSFVSVVFFVVLCMCSALVFAEHDSSAELQPEWSSAGQTMDYTVTFYNNVTSPDDIGEVRIYKNENYENFVCEPESGWSLNYINTSIFEACLYVRSPDIIVPGGSETFEFSAMTSVDPIDTCSLVWQFETRDVTWPYQGAIKYLSDTTSIDSKPPNITKTVGVPQFGPCPPGDGEECWVTQSTNIIVQVTDDYPDTECEGGIDYCTYKIYLDDNPIPIFEHTFDPAEPEMNIGWVVNFTEDSKHTLEIFCIDMAGNNVTDVEVFRVDDTPPETNKHFIGPQKNESGIEWIDGVTTVELTSVDPDPTNESCNISVDKTLYLNVLARDIDDPEELSCWEPDRFCGERVIQRPDTECVMRIQVICDETFDRDDPRWFTCVEEGIDDVCATGQHVWRVYNGTPIEKDQESCHILFYYSIDKLGNTEDINVNCFFVDKKPPIVDKDDGEAIPDRGEPMFETADNPNGTFHWITTKMPIVFTCTDQDPHPSGNETLCFKVSYDYPDWGYITDSYCGGDLTPDGYCCVPAGPEDPYEFYFKEESMHNLEYYCVDAVNKSSDVEIQYYKVDDTPPHLIRKWIEGPYYGVSGDCPPDDSTDVCHIDGVSEIHIEAEDGGDICAAGVDRCYWWYYVNGTRYPPEGSSYDSFPIIFPEECEHELYIRCIDRLGNYDDDVEIFYVDKTPPETNKTYAGPQYPAEGYPKWINTETEILLNARDDAGPHDSGIKETRYRVTQVDEMNCWDQSYCEMYAQGSGEFAVYSGEFSAPQQSCHLIEYYSVDNVNKTESVKKQCVFVDDTAPDSNKIVGEPSILIGEGGDCPGCDGGYDGHVPTGSGATVSPDTITATLNPGESVEEHKIITTDEVPIGKLDVLFLFDLTGSMRDELEEAKASSIDIMNNISSRINDSAFGSGSFMDYPESYSYCGYSSTYGYDGDYPYNLDQNVTTNTSKVSSAINSLSLGNGMDGPESYARALYESQFAGWREGARKVVIIFEDNVPHDCNLGTYACSGYYSGTNTTGVDPGADATAGTSDDLPWADVVADLKAAGISVVVVNSDSDESYYPGYYSCPEVWQYATNETGGIYSILGSTDDLPAEIVASVENITATISELTLKPTPGFEGWFAWTPDAYYDVEGGETVEFNVTVTVPAGTEGGVYNLYLMVMGDGSIMAVENVTITVPCANCTSEVDWWVGRNTPIELSCNDTLPHPVGYEEVCFRISYDYPEWSYNKTPAYCEEYGDYMNDEGYCCADAEAGSPFVFYFLEETMHNLEFYCIDGLGNMGEEDIEYFKVDTVPPTTTKTHHGAYYVDSETNATYIDTNSWINLTAVDGGGICATGVKDIYWQNIVYEEEDEWYCQSPENCADWNSTVLNPEDWNTYDGSIYKEEESCHIFAYYAEDGLGNEEDIQWQCFFVDKKPPVTNKWYAGPFFEENGTEWITNETEVWLSAYDQEPHPSGVNKTYYRDVYLDKEDDWHYCYSNCTGWNEDIRFGLPTAPEPYNPSSSAGWTPWDGAPFHKEDESCHIIEYYSFDNVKKLEELNWQCVFVDNTVPVPNKTVGKPSTYCEGDECDVWEWKITTMTPITLSCDDMGPHPSDHSMVHWRIWWDGSDNWTEWYNATEGTQIYFGEECLHQLEFYCTDAVGHESERDLEWIKVEGTSFEIQLNKKWNLISVPFVMLDDSIDEVFADIADKVESVWTYDAETGNWTIYTPGPAPDSLTKMKPGWGYWVKTTDDVNLSIGGSLFSPATTPASKKIVKGWNLVGYWGTEGMPGYYGPAGNGLPAYCEFYSLGEDILDKGFASLSSYWEPYNGNPAYAPHYQWILFGDWNPQMDPGAGYWLHTNQEGEFVLPTTCGF